MKQKFNPFAVNGETHCGDCNVLLTKGKHRVKDAYIFNGVRCKFCSDIYEAKK